MSKFVPRRVGLATEIPRGRGIFIPSSGTGGGGEYGSDIDDMNRTFAIKREPVAHRVVFTVAHDIFDNWFELELEGDDTGTKSKEFNKRVQDKLTRLKAKRELTRMAVFERAYGWSILVLGYADAADDLSKPLQNATSLEEIKAYSPTQIHKIDEEKHKDEPRYGLPVTYHITRSGITAPLKVHYTRVIHFATRLLDHDYKGMSTLDPIWDDLVTLRNIRWGMGQTMYRYGSGFPDITFDGASKNQIEDWADSGAFENLSARSYFAHNEKQTLEFKGLEGRALDPLNYYLAPMEHISAGTGIPLAILRGVQAGALTGSEVNQMEYYGLISDEQTGYEDGIRQLIDIILKVIGGEEAPEYTFNWLGGFEMDELKQAELERTKAETLQIQGQWHTKNELRKMEDPEAEDLKEGGDELLGASQFEPFGDKENEKFEEKGDSYIVTPVGRRGSRGSVGRRRPAKKA